MSADSHISWILIRLSEHSRAEFDLLGTPGGSPTHRFPTFPHCSQPSCCCSSLLATDPCWLSPLHSPPFGAQLQSSKTQHTSRCWAALWPVCMCVRVCVCVGRRKRHWLTWCPANTPVLAVWDYEGRDGSFWTPFAASRLFSAVLVWIVFMSVGF